MDRPKPGWRNWRRQLWVATAALLVIVGSVAVADAASLGTISAQTLGTSANTFTGCSGISSAIRTRFVAATRYEIASVILTGVPTACQSKSYNLTIADGDASGTSLGQLTGTTSAGGTTTISFTSGTGPLLNSINNTNSNVKVVVVIAS